jgi:SpoIIAA-like
VLELVKGLPDNVIGIVAKGRVTKEECDSVLRPAMESSLKRHVKPRLYYEIGCRFPGAGWEDLEIGLDRLPQWERVAVVTDTAWVRQTVNALRFLLASEVRVFTSFEAAEGRAWIASVCGAPETAAGPVLIAPLRAPFSLVPVSPLRYRRPSSRPARRGGRRYRRPSAGGR